ncbi:MAG TPA: hypothetical protein DCY17_02905 [Clostridiales bacterium]|nr:hypothetical protein [Clostridiales bacterium]
MKQAFKLPQGFPAAVSFLFAYELFAKSEKTSSHFAAKIGCTHGIFTVLNTISPSEMLFPHVLRLKFF